MFFLIDVQISIHVNNKSTQLQNLHASKNQKKIFVTFMFYTRKKIDFIIIYCKNYIKIL
jgi:hypothetical protein